MNYPIQLRKILKNKKYNKMNNPFDQLRMHLNSMLEIIDNYQAPLDELIIINKHDLVDLKYIGKTNSYRHIFEFRKSIRFSLPDSGYSYQYEVSHYKKIMDGSIERIILNKIENPSEDSETNYKLEEWHKTKLRDLYSTD